MDQPVTDDQFFLWAIAFVALHFIAWGWYLFRVVRMEIRLRQDIKDLYRNWTWSDGPPKQ
jgi:hypothetical protein